jgi:hypothetical protein
MIFSIQLTDELGGAHPEFMGLYRMAVRREEKGNAFGRWE